MIALFLKQIVRTGSVQFFGLLLSIASSVYLANLLGPSGLGIFTALVATGSVLAIPVQKSLQTLTLKMLAAYDRKQLYGSHNGYIYFSILWVCAYSSLAGLALLGLGTYLWLEVLFLTIFVFSTGMTNFLVGFMRSQDKLFSAILPESLLRPLFFMMAVFFFSDWIQNSEDSISFYLFSISVLSVLLVSSVFFWKEDLLHKKVNYVGRLRDWFVDLSYLSVFSGSKVLEAQLAILVLSYFAESAEVGLFKVAVTGASLVAFGALAVNFVIASKLSRLDYVKNRDDVQKLLSSTGLITLLITAPLTAIFIYFAEDIVVLCFGGEFIESVAILRVMVFLQAINISFGPVVVLLNMGGRSKIVMQSGLISALLNMVFSMTLIPTLGLWGGVCSYGISLFVWNLVLFGYIYRKFSVNPSVFSCMSLVGRYLN